MKKLSLKFVASKLAGLNKKIGLKKIFVKIRLIKLSRIQDASEYQISFLGETDSHEDLELMKVMDRINVREGHEMVKIAACGVNKEAWYMKQVLKSPAPAAPAAGVSPG